MYILKEIEYDHWDDEETFVILGGAMDKKTVERHKKRIEDEISDHNQYCDEQREAFYKGLKDIFVTQYIDKWAEKDSTDKSKVDYHFEWFLKANFLEELKHMREKYRYKQPVNLEIEEIETYE